MALIDRTEFVRNLSRIPGWADADGDTLVSVADIRSLIYQARTVDAAPVVFCKDCKYGEPDTNGRGEDMVMCQNKLNPIGDGYWLMPPEFYCADGERRDSE